MKNIFLMVPPLLPGQIHPCFDDSWTHRCPDAFATEDAHGALPGEGVEGGLVLSKQLPTRIRRRVEMFNESLRNLSHSKSI